MAAPLKLGNIGTLTVYCDADEFEAIAAATR